MEAEALLEELKKRKLEGADADDPPSKQPRADTEPEADAADDSRPRLSSPIAVEASDMTLNVLPAHGGSLLMALSDCGLHYLVAGARANVGMRAGRYLYEARIVEASASGTGGSGAKGAPKPIVRLGFSPRGSSLFLGETQDGFCFDADGFFTSEKTRTHAAQKFGKGDVMGVLLNLEEAQAGTVSLFRNGTRMCPPQPIPEALRGKALYPHVLFRSVSLHLHFGPQPSCRLPFRCRALQDAARADVEDLPSDVPKDGRHSVIFPVSLPDEGAFDWLDGFLERNPQYVELSDRKLLDWAAKSGLWRPPKSASPKHSNDRPDMNFGIPILDDLSARKLLHSVAHLVPRHYVVMEVKSNLSREERSEVALKFRPSQFRRKAHVMVGEPNAAHVERVHAKILAEKQMCLDAEWHAKKTQKASADARKIAEEKRKKLLRDSKKKGAEEQAEDGAAQEDAEPKAEEEAEDFVASEPEKAGLTTEESNQKFSAPVVCDVSPCVLSSSFNRFSLPSQDEPFDEIIFEWAQKDEAESHLQAWVRERKVSLRLEDLQPGEWFRARANDWQKSALEWTAKQKQFKLDPAFKEKQAAKQASDQLAKEGGGDAKAEDEEDGEDIDLLAVEDVTMTAKGEPLFQHFGAEDWALVQLRFELHLLVRAFQRDVGDDTYPGIHESNMAFYYNKYYAKALNTKAFGANSSEELVALVKDTVSLPPENPILAINQNNAALAEESFGVFVKLTEGMRRERQRRLDAGDESAKLKFNFAALGVGVGGVPGLRPLASVRQNVLGGSAAAAMARLAGGTWNAGPSAWQRPTYAPKATQW